MEIVFLHKFYILFVNKDRPKLSKITHYLPPLKILYPPLLGISAGRYPRKCFIARQVQLFCTSAQYKNALRFLYKSLPGIMLSVPSWFYFLPCVCILQVFRKGEEGNNIGTFTWIWGRILAIGTPKPTKCLILIKKILGNKMLSNISS